MISTHGYVAAQPPLGAADTGGQVVYVLELSKKLAHLGYEVIGSTPEGLASHLRAEIDKWSPIIKGAGIRIE
jgi:tripartite-type tricarboxylate transporter receptor subunit TctC